MYATGYRYNTNKNTLEKTGILYLESIPKSAMIFLNGQYRAETPRRFAYMLPGTYQVEVSKDGYYTWKKELEVKSNLTTFSRDIILLKKDFPRTIIDGHISTFAPSSNNNFAFYIKTEEETESINVLNLKNQSTQKISDFDKSTYTNLEFISWSPNNTKILLKQMVGDFQKYLIVDIQDQSIKELFDITRLNFDIVTWDYNNNEIIYGVRNPYIYKVSLSENTAEQLLSADVADIQVRANELFYIAKQEQDIFLVKQDLTDTDPANIKKIKLPLLSNFKLQPSPDNYIVLLDKLQNDLFVLDISAFEGVNIEEKIILQEKAKGLHWIDQQNNLLYYNDFELWSYDINSKQRLLINRYSDSISDAKWYINSKHIIFNIKNSIRIIDADNNKEKNETTIAELPIIGQSTVNRNGEVIYFIGEAGNQKGIFAVELQ
jgi:hypothetical protein